MHLWLEAVRHDFARQALSQLAHVCITGQPRSYPLSLERVCAWSLLPAVFIDNTLSQPASCVADLHDATSGIASVSSKQQCIAADRLTGCVCAGILSVPPQAYGELRGNFTDVLAAMAPDRSVFAEVTAQRLSHLCVRRVSAGCTPGSQQASSRCWSASTTVWPVIALDPAACTRMEVCAWGHADVSLQLDASNSMPLYHNPCRLSVTSLESEGVERMSGAACLQCDVL